MADEKSDDEGSIFRVDTVPPPAGDGDAYNAPTKVGPVSAEAWVELIKQADAAAKKTADAEKSLGEAAPHSKPPASRGKGGATPGDAAPASGQPAPAAPQVTHGEVPRLYADADDSDDAGAATMLSPNAKGLVDSSMRADASVFGQVPPSSSAPAEPASEAAPQSVLTPPRRGGVSPLAIAIAVCVLLLWIGVAYYVVRP